MNEILIRIKVEQEKAFSRSALCIRKSAGGIGIIKLSSQMIKLVLKLFVGNKSKKRKNN